MFVPWNGWFQNILENKSGLLSVFGAFIIQLCAGAYHGTFGNLLPYFLSYLKQVDIVKIKYKRSFFYV